MRAMILAAGRGARMRHLTEHQPKALLRVRGRYLIEYSIAALSKIGVQEIIINVCYQAEKIKSALGSGAQYGVNIIYSEEQEALETGGGILKVLPLFGSEPFIVLSCDVICDYPLKNLVLAKDKLAHLVVVTNPDFHPRGDFCLTENRVYLGKDKTYTFSNIGIYRKELFANCQPGKFGLGNLLMEAAQKNQITGEYYEGFWANLGTPDQLENMAALPDNLL